MVMPANSDTTMDERQTRRYYKNSLYDYEGPSKRSAFLFGDAENIGCFCDRRRGI